MEPTLIILENKLEKILCSGHWTRTSPLNVGLNHIYEAGYQDGILGAKYDCRWSAAGNIARYIWGYLDGVGDFEAGLD